MTEENEKKPIETDENNELGAVYLCPVCGAVLKPEFDVDCDGGRFADGHYSCPKCGYEGDAWE